MKEFRKLYANEVEVRVGSVSKDASKPWCSLLLYKDARVDMRILDETVGAMNWKREHKVIDGNLYCTISIYNEEIDEWVSKEDVGTKSNTEEEKGQASDSFKRAGVNWGIGRELYSSPQIMIFGGGKNTKGRVEVLDYNEHGDIKTLKIVGRKNCYDRMPEEVLFWMKDGKMVRLDEGNARKDESRAVQMRVEAPSMAQKATVEVPDGIVRIAESCQSLEALKDYQKSLIKDALWRDEYKSTFNNIVKNRRWI